MRSLFVLFLFAFFGTAAKAAPCRYTVITYGWENWRDALLLSHTFAEFHELCPGQPVKVVRLNWLPAEGETLSRIDLRVPLIGMKRGQNLDVSDAIARAAQGRPRVQRTTYAFGPFECRQELFEIAQEREGQLARGIKKYAASSTWRKAQSEKAPQCYQTLDFFGDLGARVLDRGAEPAAMALESYARNGYLLEKLPATLVGVKVGAAVRPEGPAVLTTPPPPPPPPERRGLFRRR